MTTTYDIIPATTDQQELAAQHMGTIERAIGEVVLRDMDYGRSPDGSWARVERLGKQQPVSIVEFSFPESQEPVPVVFRPTFRDFAVYYAKHQAVRDYFPTLYGQQEVAYGTQGTQTVLAVEKIEGTHGDVPYDPTGNPFEKRVADLKEFEKLCQDMFAATDAILREPLMIEDTLPSRGHNVIYNESQQRYMFFDVDTLKDSDKPHAQKFIEFLAPQQRTKDMQQIGFIARMFQMYTEKYPDAVFAQESAEREFSEYVVDTDATSGSEGVLRPGDTEYVKAYMHAVVWGDSKVDKDVSPPIRLVTRTGKDFYDIAPEMRSALLANDLRKAQELLNSNNGYLVSRTFVENE